METKKKKYDADKKSRAKRNPDNIEKTAKKQQTLNFWQMNLKFIF